MRWRSSSNPDMGACLPDLWCLTVWPVSLAPGCRARKIHVERGTPGYIRSDNGPEFTAAAVRKWLGQVSVGTLFIEPGSPWENGYVESFNGKFRAEFLNRELFDTLLEAQVLVERWRHEYNTFRPHSALGYRPPAPEAIEPKTAPGVR